MSAEPISNLIMSPRDIIQAAPALVPQLAQGMEPYSITPSPFVWRDPKLIPPRRFLYDFMLKRKQITAFIAPGAAGKTTLKVGIAICMAANKQFLGHKVWNGPHRVWLINLEDEREEIEKLVHAYLLAWNLTPADLGDRLLIDGADSPDVKALKLAYDDKRNGLIIRRPVIAGITEALIELKIDWCDVDPFVSSHGVNENDNGQVDAVTKEWLGIANTTASAISLTHHIKKPAMGAEPSAYDARGAVAMINAARSVPIINKMTKAQAEDLGIAECDRKRFVSLYDDKNNKAPPALKAHWFEFHSIALENGDELNPRGDSIGILKQWTPPDDFAGVTAAKLRHIQMKIESLPEKARASSKSKNWVGHIVADVLDRDIDTAEAGISAKEKDERTKSVKLIQRMLRTWVDAGALVKSERYDATAKGEVEFLEVGEWAILEK